MGLISRVSSRTYRTSVLREKPSVLQITCPKMNPHMSYEDNLKNIRDFKNLQIKTIDKCFNDCVSNFNKRTLSVNEQICFRSCARKNNAACARTLLEFQNVMPTFLEKKNLDMQEQLKKKEELEEKIILERQLRPEKLRLQEIENKSLKAKLEASGIYT